MPQLNCKNKVFQSFCKMKYIKPKYRSAVSDKHLESILKHTTTVQRNIGREIAYLPLIKNIYNL